MNKLQSQAPVTMLFIAAALVIQLLGASGSVAVSGLNVTLFTHPFGHSGWSHFYNNITLLLLLSISVEGYYGSLFISIISILNTVGIGLFYYFSGRSCYGLSIIVYMYIGLNMFINRNGFSIPTILVSIVYLVPEVIGLFNSDNIGHDAHIISLVIGLLSGFIFNKVSFNLRRSKLDDEVLKYAGGFYGT